MGVLPRLCIYWGCLTVAIVRGVTALELCVYVCNGLGHAKRKTCSGEDMTYKSGVSRGSWSEQDDDKALAVGISVVRSMQGGIWD